MSGINRRKAERALKEFGFTFVRETNHGFLWKNVETGKVVLVPRLLGKRSDIRAEKNWMNHFRKVTENESHDRS